MPAGRIHKFWSKDGKPLSTVSFRVPTNLPHNILDSIIIPIVKLANADETITPKHVTSVFRVKKAKVENTESTPKLKLLITAEDIDSANARALGFIAFKAGLQDKPSEIRGSEIADIRESLKAMLK